MKRRVVQTKFGGRSAPVAEWGNCMQAALATLLDIPLAAAFSFQDSYANVGAGYWMEFAEWCQARGFAPVAIDVPIPGALGLVGVESATLTKEDGSPEGHTIVVRGNRVVHDPNVLRESYIADSDPPEYIYLVPLDPAGAAREPLDNAGDVSVRRSA